MGPCSISSLRRGDLGHRWDSHVLHSTIFGQKSHWLVYPDGNMNLIGQNQLTLLFSLQNPIIVQFRWSGARDWL